MMLVLWSMSPLTTKNLLLSCTIRPPITRYIKGLSIIDNFDSIPYLSFSLSSTPPYPQRCKSKAVNLLINMLMLREEATIVSHTTATTITAGAQSARQEL